MRVKGRLFNKCLCDLTAYVIPYSHRHPIRKKILVGIKSMHTDCFADAIFHHHFRLNGRFLAESGLAGCRFGGSPRFSASIVLLFPKIRYEDN